MQNSNASSRRQDTLRMDPDKMLLYDVNPNTVYSTLKTSLNQNNIGELRASYEILPIILSAREKQINEIISAEFVTNRENAGYTNKGSGEGSASA